MPDSSRREFTKKSLLLALGPVAGESAILSSPLSTLAEPQTSGRDFFPGFRRAQIKTTGATINVVHGGKGSPVLLLHGIPETHVLWRKVAPVLAQNFTLVIADLRGYGDSSKPPGGADHFGYSKRAMAQDQVEVMEHLGFPKFAVVGHDRGGRVAHRMALDHSDRVTRLAILDIVPTYKCYQTVNQDFATVFFHWFLLVQPPPFPKQCSATAPSFSSRPCCSVSAAKRPAKACPNGWISRPITNICAASATRPRSARCAKITAQPRPSTWRTTKRISTRKSSVPFSSSGPKKARSIACTTFCRLGESARARSAAKLFPPAISFRNKSRIN